MFSLVNIQASPLSILPATVKTVFVLKKGKSPNMEPNEEKRHVRRKEEMSGLCRDDCRGRNNLSLMNEKLQQQQSAQPSESKPNKLKIGAIIGVAIALAVIFYCCFANDYEIELSRLQERDNLYYEVGKSHLSQA